MLADISPEISEVELQGESEVVHPLLADPKGWKRMMRHPRSKEFLAAVRTEMAKLEEMGAGRCIKRRDLPAGSRVLRSSFVFATKRYADTGLIEKFKARLVADGSQQEKGEQHAPTIGGTTLRVVLAVAAATRAVISKFDVESAFLVEEIDVPTYVRLPKEYTDWLGVSPVVWELLKSLYGLRQAPRLFWLGLKAALEDIGFRSSDHDPCLFVRKETDGSYSYVLTHVDDGAVISNSLARNREIREGMLKKYRGIKWEDTAQTFLGMALTREQDGSLLLSQPAYLRQVLDSLGVVADGVTMTPVRQSPRRDIPVDLSLVPWLRLAVGAVQYLAFTRLEVTLPLNIVARTMHQPTQDTREDMMRILRYLANTPMEGIHYAGGGPISLSGWVDASWQSEPGNTSRTGFVLSLGPESGAVQCYSKAQAYAALSSQHSEIIALTESVRSVLHVRMLLEDLGHPMIGPTPVWEDNVGCIAFANGTCPLAKTKHIANRDRFVREVVRDGLVAPQKVLTTLNPANGLTKEVGRAEQMLLSKFLLQGVAFARSI